MVQLRETLRGSVFLLILLLVTVNAVKSFLGHARDAVFPFPFYADYLLSFHVIPFLQVVLSSRSSVARKEGFQCLTVSLFV